MTISKKIISKKTPQGYSLTIWVKDPELYNALILGVDRFFEKAESVINNENRNDKLL